MAGIPRPRPYPADPLLAHLRVNLNCPGQHGCGTRYCDHRTFRWWQRWTGLSGGTARRIVDQGLTEVQADRFACRAGVHPMSLWPETWLANAFDEERTAA